MYTPGANDVTPSGSDVSMQREHSGDRVNLALSRPHLSPSNGGNLTSARDTILTAVENLELENAKLQHINAAMLAEVTSLQQENGRLRNELDDARWRCQRLEKDKEVLENELREQRRRLSEENDKFAKLESSLKRESELRRKECESTRRDLARRDSDCKALLRELDNLKDRLNQTQNQIAEEKDIEMFHEVEMMKAECKDLTNERNDILNVNKKLLGEIRKLEVDLEEKLSELRNENRRHSLLTKEFNSLLQENNRLKLQLRRGGQLRRPAVGSDQPTTTVERRTELGNAYSTTGLSADDSCASSRVPPFVDLRREQTQISREQTQISRERGALVSRDRTRLTRRDSAIRQDVRCAKTTNRLPTGTNDRELRHSRTAEKRLPVPINTSSGSRSESDSSQSPESLPSISATKTWRPW